LRVPGSSANLGPGFDALAIALKVYLDCKFSVGTRLSIRVTGRDAHLIPATEENLIWKTALAVAARAHLPLPPIQLAINNDIPIGKGLGSSAAALTAGVVIAERLLELRWNPPEFSMRRHGSKGTPITWLPAFSARSSPAASNPVD